MFLPKTFTKTLKPLESAEDVINALDQWVLPQYESLTSFVPAILKSDCYGILKSYFEAGKIAKELRFRDLDEAVRLFVSDRLWVGPETYQAADVAPQVEFDRWEKGFLH